MRESRGSSKSRESRESREFCESRGARRGTGAPGGGAGRRGPGDAGDIGERVAARLRSGANAVEPPPHLPGRIHAEVRARRRRRRLVEATGVVGAVSVAVGLPTVVLPQIASRVPPGVTASTARSPRPDLTLERVISVSRDLKGGRIFDALALGADGSVVGHGVSGRGRGHSDGAIWRSGPDGGPPRRVTDVNGLWAARTDGRRIVWSQKTNSGHDHQLMCAEADGDASARQVGDRGVANTEYAFATRRGTVVWNDGATGRPHTVWAVRSCAAEPRQVFEGGSAIAFAYPDVLVAGERDDGGFDGRLTRVNVESGTTVDVPLADASATLTGHEDAVFASNGKVLAWADHQGIIVLDLGSGAAARPAVRLPHSSGSGGEVARLTAGEHLLVYSVHPRDGDPGATTSLVYDLRTGRSFTLAGDAYAAGDRLMWQDGATYHVGRVS